MLEDWAVERDTELHPDDVVLDPADCCIEWPQGLNTQGYGSVDPQDRSAIIEATSTLGQIEHGDIALDATARSVLPQDGDFVPVRRSILHPSKRLAQSD